MSETEARSQLARADREKVLAMLEKHRDVNVQLTTDDQHRQMHTAMLEKIQRKFEEIDALVKELEAEAVAP